MRSIYRSIFPKPFAARQAATGCGISISIIAGPGQKKLSRADFPPDIPTTGDAPNPNPAYTRLQSRSLIFFAEPVFIPGLLPDTKEELP